MVVEYLERVVVGVNDLKREDSLGLLLHENRSVECLLMWLAMKVMEVGLDLAVDGLISEDVDWMEDSLLGS